MGYAFLVFGYSCGFRGSRSVVPKQENILMEAILGPGLALANTRMVFGTGSMETRLKTLSGEQNEIRPLIVPTS